MTQGICTIPDCGKPGNARGWCKGHYYRWGRYGDPLGSAPPRAPKPPKIRDRCTVAGCDVDQYALALCEPHYARRRRHGGLHDARAERSDPVARFWSKVQMTPTCWLWTDGPNGSGYGSFNPGGGVIGAHVYSAGLARMVIPAGQEIDHLCRTPLCVRPSHLDVVTHAENLRRARERASA